MKVMHVVHGFAPELVGGTERAVEAIARAMSAAGHEVVIVSGSITPAPTDVDDEVVIDGLRVVRLHRRDLYYEEWYKAWSPEIGARFAELLARERPAVVHVHHWLRLSSDLVRIARRTLPDAVLAVTCHDYFATCATPARRHDDGPIPEPPPCAAHVGRNERASALADHRDDFVDELRAAHLRYAPCASHADGLRETAPGPLGPIEVCPPPLLAVPSRAARRESAARGKRLVTWGTIYPDKGLDLVFDALFSIGSGWSLDVYGEAHDPVYRERLLVRARGMPVRLHGAFTTADLGAIDADYALLPSMCHESYGLTLDEALCLGLPVIAADLPAYRERAPQRSTAFFAAGDAGALAQLLLDEQRLAALEVPAAPRIVTAADIGARLIVDYAAARRGGPSVGADLAPRFDEARRARAMFRRAEWRHWSVLQHPGGAPAAPQDFEPA